MATQAEIRQEITNQIVHALESGDIPPWRQPWTNLGGGLPKNAVSGNRYSGVNILLLQASSQRNHFRSSLWATYRQWQERGGQVKRRPDDVPKGEWGTRIVFYKPVTKVVTDDRTGDEKEESFPILKTYTVFNLDQVEGESLDHLRTDEPTTSNEFVDYEPAEEVIRQTGADIRYGGDRAFYRPSSDFIQLPHREQFEPSHEFYSVAYHEIGHWTGAAHRLNRIKGQRFGDEAYAEEELVAELCSSYLLAETGVPQSDDLSTHTAYLSNWLKALKNDTRFIFRASTAASKAADCVLRFSESPVTA